MAKHNIKPDTIIRTVCLAIALLNQVLAATGKSPLPIKDEEVAELVSTAFTIVTATWAWWKNNSFSQAAIAGDVVMKSIKNRQTLEDTE